MTQNSKQSQNNINKNKNKKSVSDFHNSCNVKEMKQIKNWKNIM